MQPEQEDNHVPDQIEEAKLPDREQDSSDPQTPPETGSPTIRYKTAKQTLDTADRGPFFLPEEQKKQSESEITPSNTKQSLPPLQNKTQSQQPKTLELDTCLSPPE